MSTMMKCEKCGNGFVQVGNRNLPVIKCPCGGLARPPEDVYAKEKARRHRRHLRAELRELNRCNR
jgi:hypothetical protein